MILDKKNYIAFDNKTSMAILKEKSQPSAVNNENKTIYVFAGPNGSGKSTLIANLYAKNKLDAEYVNADMYCLTMFDKIQDENERNKSAMKYSMRKVDEYIEKGKSFVYETVLSHPSKIDLLNKAKENGYNIVSMFVYTDRPEINMERVLLRVEQGGHNVPKEKIVSRYYRSLELSLDLEMISNEFDAFDNTQNLEIYTDYKK